MLATMQTASMDGFREAVIDGDHLLLVADEVHHIGSPQHARIMKFDAGTRLGLSATPVRYGDPEGTGRIFDYFGGRRISADNARGCNRGGPPCSV